MSQKVNNAADFENISYSFVIPVYNRPHEVAELLESLTRQTKNDFEVVIIEDGSTISSEDVCNKFSDRLNIRYHFKTNSGPGDSRNDGMRIAKGTYYLILDSDCILPPEYLAQVHQSLAQDYVDCFGGVDTALDSFSDTQKAINFAMTSVLTTGGVRGASEKLGKFQPRSFNMGISKKAFQASNGFSKIHPGEDPDLSIRLWKLGFETRLFKNVYVYHKRRIDWDKYKIQVNKFGKVRPILNKWYPEYSKLTFWFPSLFIVGFVVAAILRFIGYPVLLKLYATYFLVCFLTSSLQNKSLKIGALSLWAIVIQFYGYGSGFLTSFYRIFIKNQKPEKAFPELFF
ncbi:MAG: glycosyltransferase family 2 protein [Chitinophagales bacterium]|nr:glycosyltransferase family 2 protein [Chitinophagales bacterium]